MRYYTVEEAAKKLKVSKGHIYGLVKSGEIKKKEGVGRAIRIPSSELKTANVKTIKDRWSNFDKDKVELIQTSCGSIRRIKDKNAYVASDIAKSLSKSDSYVIKKIISSSEIIHLEHEETKEYGLLSTKMGIDLITIQGIKEYLKKAILPSDFETELFIEQLLKIDKQSSIDEVKEIVSGQQPRQSMKIFEGHEVEVIIEDGQPLFELYSTGIALGYSKWNGRRTHCTPAKDRIDKVVKNAGLSPCLYGVSRYLTESMLYDFMLEARTEKCKAFRRWVTNEVLPTIRKTGGYVDNSVKFVDNYFSSLSKNTKEIILVELEKKNKALMAERVKIDKELLDNVTVIEKIQETL